MALLLLLLITKMKVTLVHCALVVTMTGHCCCDMSRQEGHLMAHLLLTTEMQVSLVVTMTSCCDMSRLEGHLMAHLLL